MDTSASATRNVTHIPGSDIMWEASGNEIRIWRRRAIIAHYVFFSGLFGFFGLFLLAFSDLEQTMREATGGSRVLGIALFLGAGASICLWGYWFTHRTPRRIVVDHDSIICSWWFSKATYSLREVERFALGSSRTGGRVPHRETQLTVEFSSGKRIPLVGVISLAVAPEIEALAEVLERHRLNLVEGT